MKQRMFWALALAALGGLAACSKTPAEPAPEAALPRTTAGAPAATGTPAPATPRGPADVAYDAPAGWTKVDNPSPMRKATYRIPRAEGDAEDAEMSVTQAGGTVEANVKRWSGQFEQGKDDLSSRQEKKIADLKVTVVELHGTFSGSGMPGAPAGPKPKWALLGAIVETEGSLTFFKLTGPEKTVVAAKPGFDKLVESLRAK